MASDSVGRYDAYRYDVLKLKALREFGSWCLHYCMLHKVDDMFVMSMHGHRIVEIHSDDSCFLVVPPDISVSSVCNSWALLSPNTYFINHVTKHASGLVTYQFERYTQDQHYARTSRFTGKCTTTGRFLYGLDGSLSIEGVPQKEVIQDRAKYRVFNVRLRGLRAVLFAQIKMQAKHMVSPDWQGRYEMQKQISEILHDVYGLSGVYDDLTAYRLVMHWMDSQNPKIANHIAQLAFSRCMTMATGMEGMLCRVKNILTRAQRYYLREHCVTITEAIPGSDNDQNRELQPPD